MNRYQKRRHLKIKQLIREDRSPAGLDYRKAKRLLKYIEVFRDDFNCDAEEARVLSERAMRTGYSSDRVFWIGALYFIGRTPKEEWFL